MIRSCWSIEHTKRPTAPEIVDFLATNQRVIAPCLDVPLASVQLEHTGEMEMQLNTPTDRKFSFPWSGQSSPAQKSGNKSPPTIDMPLVDINDSSSTRDQHIDSLLGTSSTSELESAKPLLNEASDSVPDSSKDTAARYVNMQPGVTSTFLDVPSMPMNGRKSPIPRTNHFNNISFL